MPPREDLKNDTRFGVIHRAAAACDKIEKQLDEVDDLNSAINDLHMTNLIANANEINSNLLTSLRGDEYNKLLKHAPDLESIVYLVTQLDELIDDPARYDRAIEMLDYCDSLTKNYAHEITIIGAIHKQTERQRQYLVANLCCRLDSLKESSITESKSVVNQLIRSGSLSARELRLRYLEARDNWFNEECEAKSESFNELISFFCKGLPRIFEEYKSIFGDLSNMSDNRLLTISGGDTTLETGAIINSWLLLKTSTFISSLEIHLKSNAQSRFLTPTLIGDTMLECFKLTNWLASIGFDFSSQLNPIFSRALVEEVRSTIERVTVKFETEFTTIISKSIESLLLPVNDEILRISNMKPEEQIPASIGHYPIFKTYCLHLIDSLRWIQTTKNILSPIGLCLDTYAALNASLTRVMKALAVVLNMDNNSNHPILTKIAISFLTEVLPFLANYCELLFPEKVILNTLGISKTDFKSLCLNEPNQVKDFRLDLRQIGDPLRGTMPALMATIEGWW